MAVNETMSLNSSKILLGGLTLSYVYIPLEKYAYLATGVIMYYDYILTLSLEITEIWSSGWSVATALFLLNRYPSLVYKAAGIIFEFYSNKSREACDITDTIAKVFLILPSIAVSAIFALRVYALYHRSRSVLVLLAVLGLGSIATNVWFAIEETNFVVLIKYVKTCAVIGPDAVPWKLANYATFLAFDTVVFILTLARTLGIVLQKRCLKMPTSNLVDQLLRDGMLYYFPLLCLYIAEICLVAIPSVPQEGISILGPFVNAISIVLVNRLVLNLRRKGHVNAEEDSFAKVSLSMFASNSIIGNLGEPLKDVWETEDSSGGYCSGSFNEISLSETFAV